MPRRIGPDILIANKSYFARNRLGQFTARLDQAAKDSLMEIIEVGAAAARRAAPDGRTSEYQSVRERTDFARRPRLRSNIQTVMFNSREGSWLVDAPNALSIETGAGPHEIHARNTDNLRFFWEREGRWVKTPMVHHPGNRAQPFLDAGLAAADAAAEQILRRHYGAV